MDCKNFLILLHMVHIQQKLPDYLYPIGTGMFRFSLFTQSCQCNIVNCDLKKILIITLKTKAIDDI